jgi:hypothetical protein
VVAGVVVEAAVAATLLAECHAAASLVAEWARPAFLVPECDLAARILIVPPHLTAATSLAVISMGETWLAVTLLAAISMAAI